MRYNLPLTPLEFDALKAELAKKRGEPILDDILLKILDIDLRNRKEEKLAKRLRRMESD